MGDKAWSFSALNNFESCPKKYWHLSIEKDVKEEEGEAIKYGKAVHKALEDYVGKGKALPKKFSHMAPYVQSFVDVKAKKKLVEQQLAITKEFVPCDWRDWNNAWCRAVVDLAIMGEKHALLIDYKTGKMKDDGFTQLGLAAAIFMAHYPEIETVGVAYLWTEAKGKMTHEKFNRSDLTALWNGLLPRVERFQHAYRISDYPARPSGLCRKWCPVTSCPHHGQ